MKNDINDTTTEVKIKQLPHAEGLPLPEYKTAGSVGFDFQAAIAKEDILILAPGNRISVPTGLVVAIPEGLELQVRPRSGLAMYYGIMVVNTPGTIDQDYRGELIVLLINTDKDKTFVISRGDRIAQGVISPIERVRFRQVSELPTTVRGESGFGSTGI